MTLLILSIAVVLLVSALCSLTEAALYAVRASYVRSLASKGSRAGRILSDFKANMERPITSILVVNTAANTAGATVAGAQAELVLGHQALVWFSVAFTAAVLFFSEIGPKIVGVAYSNVVARSVAVGLNVVTTALQPIVWVVHMISRLVLPRGGVAIAPEEEVSHVAQMSAEEGSILPMEADLVQNVLKLDDLSAAQIMTPRSVVVSFPAGMTLAEVAARERYWAHGRIPVTGAGDPEQWVGVVLRRDILAGLAEDRHDAKLGDLCKPIHCVPATMPCHTLLKAFLAHRSHLFGVLDAAGRQVGIVTLEDVMESVLGKEIVDETDQVVDMQELAKVREARSSGAAAPDRPGDPTSRR